MKHSFSYIGYFALKSHSIFFLCVKTSRAFSCINSLLPSTPRYWKSGIRVENKLFHAQGLESISHEEGVYGSQVGIHFTRPVHVQPILLQLQIPLVRYLFGFRALRNEFSFKLNVKKRHEPFHERLHPLMKLQLMLGSSLVYSLSIYSHPAFNALKPFKHTLCDSIYLLCKT